MGSGSGQIHSSGNKPLGCKIEKPQLSRRPDLILGTGVGIQGPTKRTRRSTTRTRQGKNLWRGFGSGLNRGN